MPSPGDVVTVDFPGVTGIKRRPAVVVSTAEYHHHRLPLRIGSAAGATDIVNWTATASNSLTRSGLGLVTGRQYWLAVQARNVGGLWSASGYSAFVAGQPIRSVFLPLVLRKR